MSQAKLRREVGIFGATMMGLGAIVGTGIFVSIGEATALAGPWIMLVIGIAAMVAILNGLSSAQLAAAHPVSGGTYEYGYRWLHPSLGFIAGWLFLCAKSASAATAALGFAEYGLRILPWEAGQFKIPIGLLALGVVLVFILLGIRWSSRLNACVVLVTLTSLSVFVVAGIMTLAITHQPQAVTEILEPSHDNPSLYNVLESCALMFVAYTGYGRIATMGEEIRHPERNIPFAIILTLGISMVLYMSVAWVSVTVVGANAFRNAAISDSAPLEQVARSFSMPQISYVVASGAVTAMLGVLINLVLGLSRVALAMGRRGDLPKSLSRVDETGRAPSYAVLFVGCLIGSLICIGDVKLTWSFSAFTVLVYYAITHLAALRMSAGERRYPQTLAWLGFLSCIFLAFWIDPKIWLAGLALILIGLVGWGWQKRRPQVQACR